MYLTKGVEETSLRQGAREEWRGERGHGGIPIFAKTGNGAVRIQERKMGEAIVSEGLLPSEANRRSRPVLPAFAVGRCPV